MKYTSFSAQVSSNQEGQFTLFWLCGGASHKRVFIKGDTLKTAIKHLHGLTGVPLDNKEQAALKSVLDWANERA